MKKVDLKFAIVALTGLFCISGQRALPDIKQEPKASEQKELSSNLESASQTISQGEMGNKGAAQRVVEGTSNSSMNGKRKSAAQLAVEGG